MIETGRTFAGHVMLTDFGIARMGAEASDLTGTGVTVGTLNYASPEQLQGETIDARSDKYSLAATAYHLLAGAPPFANGNAVKIISGHLGAPVPTIASRSSGLPARVDGVLARGLAKDPAHRFASSSEFAASLQSALLSVHSGVTAREMGAGVAALASSPPNSLSSALPKGSWCASAVVVAFAVTAMGLNWAYGWQLAWMAGALAVAAYLAATAKSNVRRLAAALLALFAGFLLAWGT